MTSILEHLNPLNYFSLFNLGIIVLIIWTVIGTYCGFRDKVDISGTTKELPVYSNKEALIYFIKCGPLIIFLCLLSTVINYFANSLGYVKKEEAEVLKKLEENLVVTIHTAKADIEFTKESEEACAEHIQHLLEKGIEYTMSIRNKN